MKVLFLPGSPNPYQRELAAALGRLSVQTEIGVHKRFLPVLRAVAAHGKPEILHLHWIDPLALGRTPVMTALKGLRLLGELTALRLMGVRVVWTVHNLMDHDQRSPRLQMLINRSVAFLSNRIIVHSRSAKTIVERAFRTPESRLSVVPHASFAETYAKHLSREDARRKLRLPEDALVYLHFGVLREYKGTRDLLDKFQELDLPRARLLIAGRPANEEVATYIQRVAAGDARIMANLCFVPEEDVHLYVSASDVVVMPYRESLTSGVAMLAMGFGKPVIAPRTPVMEEVLAPGANLLYEREDGAGLAAAMLKAATSDLEAKGSKSLARARELSWDEMATQTKTVYDMVLRPQNKAPDQGSPS